jgi:hypothetical protein
VRSDAEFRALCSEMDMPELAARPSSRPRSAATLFATRSTDTSRCGLDADPHEVMHRLRRAACPRRRCTGALSSPISPARAATCRADQPPLGSLRKAPPSARAGCPRRSSARRRCSASTRARCAATGSVLPTRRSRR